MIRLGRESILDNFTFTETIPRASQHDEYYLRTVAQGIQQCDPPVEMDLDEVKGPGLRIDTCLVVRPTDRRLRKYPTLHFAQPMNSSLQMGYYLIGGDNEPHQSTLRAQFGIGQASAADVENVLSIVDLIRDYAVMPAISHIAELVQAGPRRGGFFGT